MPKVTTLPFLTTGTDATSFFVVDNRATKRLRYTDVINKVVGDLQDADFTGPAGPSGPASTVPGPPGPTGPAGPNSIGIPAGGETGQVLTKTTSTSYIVDWIDSGGIGLSSRNTITTSTVGSIAPNSAQSIQLTGYKTYVLSNVTTNYPAWVRIYSNSSSRTADAARSIDVDPLPGAGVIAEVITSPGLLSQRITPGVIGFNDDETVNSTVYISVVNKDTFARLVSVSVTLLQMES